MSRTISSSAPNGSSISNRSGSNDSARAIEARCCMPPDNCQGNLLPKPDEIDEFEPRWRRASSRSALPNPMISSGSAMLLATVRQG